MQRLQTHFKKMAFLIPLLVIAYPAAADQTAIQPQTQGEVTFISGGVGIEEQQAMKDVKSEYNLNLVFSEKDSGDYISDVKVSVKDAKGKLCFEAVSDGPMLFAKLKPGRYSLILDRNGKVIDKHINLEGAKHASLSLSWAE